MGPYRVVQAPTYAAPAPAQYTYTAAPAQALFNAVDRNNDGVVTRAEFNQAFAPQAQPVTYAAPAVQTYTMPQVVQAPTYAAPAAVYAQPAALTTGLFNAVDRNNDGVVSRAEFNQAFATHAA